MKTRCFSRGNENEGVHVEFSVRHHPLRIPIPMLEKKTRKRYVVRETSDFTRNKFWLASCFSEIKKPNKYCLGNQTKFLIFLRNNRVCMIDPYKARKSWSSRT